MDLTVPVAILAAAGVVRTPTVEFLKRVSGPAADELGEWIRDSIRTFRAQNAGRAMSRAEEMLAEAGQEARAVPFRTLLPLLEGASLEDEPDLAEHWAALLANAASTTTATLPIFPAVLSQMTPIDALVLSTTHDLESAGLVQDSPVEELPRWGVRRVELTQRLTTPAEDLDVSLNTLAALGLIDNEPLVRHANHSIFVSDNFEFRVSALGRKFLRACSPPRTDNKESPSVHAV